jgi:hypothetical protein
MTSSEIVEEILYEAHTLGIADKVFKVSKTFRDKGMDLLESYQEAFLEVIGETSDID